MPDYKPFRWDLSKREQLPALEGVELSPYWTWFTEELRPCAARVIAAAGDSDWVFVGRSPEHLFDYLSGVFEGIPAAPSLTLLLVSMSGTSWDTIDRAARERPQAFAAISSYFTAERLDPEAIASSGNTVTFIDVVSRGGTFGALARFLRRWCREQRIDWNAVQRRLRFVGLTERGKTSPKTWRWQQHQAWLAALPDARVRNVSLHPQTWNLMAAGLAKVTPSHTIDRWAVLRGGGSAHGKEQMTALAAACRLYDLGRAREERLALAATIARLPDMRDPWLRSLVLKLRQKSKHR